MRKGIIMARYIKCPSCGYIGKAKIVDWDLGGCLIAIILLICLLYSWHNLYSLEG